MYVHLTQLSRYGGIQATSIVPMINQFVIGNRNLVTIYISKFQGYKLEANDLLEALCLYVLNQLMSLPLWSSHNNLG